MWHQSDEFRETRRTVTQTCIFFFFFLQVKWYWHGECVEFCYHQNLISFVVFSNSGLCRYFFVLSHLLLRLKIPSQIHRNMPPANQVLNVQRSENVGNLENLARKYRRIRGNTPSMEYSTKQSTFASITTSVSSGLAAWLVKRKSHRLPLSLADRTIESK